MKKIISLLTISATLFISCGKEKEEITKVEPAIAVKVSGVSKDDHGAFVTASGKIEAENSATLATRIMGYVNKVHVKVGQKVTAGQILVSVNNADLQAKKAQVDAAILQSIAGFNNAKKDYDRFTVLFSQQSASQKELDDMTSRYEIAKAALEGTKQMRNEVMAQFSYSNITAPFSGKVTNTFVKEGDMANPGMPLLNVEGANQLQVIAMVSENDINDIETDMTAKVLIKSNNQKLIGKVVEVSGSAKSTGGQYLIKINLINPGKNVLSGMYVNVQFPIAHRTTGSTMQSDKVLVPTNALISQGQLTGLYTIGSNNTAILRWLRIGKSYGDQVEILSGLSRDEQYIVSAEGKLYNGAKVSIK